MDDFNKISEVIKKIFKYTDDEGIKIPSGLLQVSIDSKERKAEYIEELYNDNPIKSKQIRKGTILKILQPSGFKGSHISDDFISKLAISFENHNKRLKDENDDKLKEYLIKKEDIEYIKEIKAIKGNSGEIVSTNYMSNLFNENTSPSSIKNSIWYLFERVGKKPEIEANWGIAIREVIFLEDNGNYIPVKLKTKNLEGNNEISYIGCATTHPNSNGKYIYLDLVKETDKMRSNIVFRINEEDKLESQTLLIGHYTSHSIQYQRLLSKVVVLVKHTELPTDVEIGHVEYKSEKYKKLPDSIQTFLYSRELNRMSMPQNAITSINQLEEFLQDYQVKNIDRDLKKDFVGRYFVYYKRSDKKIIEDSFEVYFNEHSNSLQTTYSHATDKKQKNKKKWIGKPYRNTTKQCIFISLINVESMVSTEVEENPILLSFQMPSDKDAWSDSNCYHGTIAGLEDSDHTKPVNGGIAFVCFVIKETIKNHEKLDEVKNRFFEIHSEALSIKPNNSKVHFDIDGYLSDN